MQVDRERARRQLPHVYAEALRLRDEGCEPSDIARAVGVAPEAVHSLLQIGDAKVSLLLAQVEPGGAE